MKQAKIPTCHPDRAHKGRGLCQKCHYKLWSSSPKAKKKKKESDRAYREKAGEALKKKKKQYYNSEAGRLCRRRDQIKGAYGITAEEYDQLKSSHNGLCKLCGLNKPLNLDHCHSTGLIRGFICTKCNTAVGRLEKIPGWREVIPQYLLSSTLL